MVTIRSYPELSRAIRKRVGSRKLRRMSKRERLAFASRMGWSYQPPVAFGTKQKVTTTVAQLQKAPTLTKQEQKSIKELGAVRAIEPTKRGFKYTAATPTAAAILADYTRSTIQKRNIQAKKQQEQNIKKALASKKIVTAVGVRQLVSAQKK